MRIVTDSQVRRWAKRYPQASHSLLGWLETVKAADWTDLAQVRKTYRHADPVAVGSGKTVTVFNIAGNDFRLITAIHYNTGVVFALMLLTHAEYSKDRWKAKL